MRKIVRLALWTFAILLVIVLVLGLYLRRADLSAYEEHIEGYLSDKIGHELDFGGLFELRFGALTKLTADDVTLSNTDWPGETVIVSAGHISVTIDVWSLIRGPLIIENLEARDITVYLERDIEGHANWMTGRPGRDEPRAVNTELIAFRDVTIDTVRMTLIDPMRPRPIDISLEFVNVRPDENDVLDLDLQGAVNEFPLWADGKLGPWQNLLDGKDLIADLDVSLGQVRLAVEGSAEDTRVLGGIEATLSLDGPSIERVIDRLGFPPFAQGEFQIDGRLRKLDGGNQVRLEGNVGAINVLASGSVDRLLRPTSTQYDFNVAGPNARHVAEVFGINGVPGVPFQVTGDFRRDGRRVSLTDTHAKIGDNAVAVDGWLDGRGALPDLNVMVNASGPDFSVFAPFIGVHGVPAEAFDVDGRIEKNAGSWQFTNVVATVGENRVAANGSIREGQDTEVEFSATGPDISFLQPMTGLQGLPKKPYEVSARIKPARNGVRIEGATGLFGDNRVNIDGVVSTSNGLSGTQLNFRASGPELHNVALLTGIPYLPRGPFETAGDVEVDRDRFVINNAAATAGALHASASGTIGIGGSAGEFDLLVTAEGSDVGSVQQIEALQRLSGEPFSLSGRVKGLSDGDDLTFEDARVQIGEIALIADGTLSMQPLSNDSDLRFSLSGPDMDQFGRAVGTEIFVANAFQINGQFIGTPSGFAMRDFAAKIGDNDVSGVFEVDLREKPRVTGSLSSAFLDLTERLQQAGEQAEAAPNAAEDEFVFPDEPLDTTLLQAADIQIDVVIDDLRVRSLAVTDFHVGIKLLDGELQIDPISLAESEGSVVGQLRIAPSGGKYMLDASLAVQNIHFGLIASQDQDRSTLPPIGGDFTLRGKGNSLHELVASSNGVLAMRQGSGRIIDKGVDRLFGDMLLQIMRALNPLRKKQVYREFDCGIYDVVIADGIATLKNVAVQTKTMTVLAVGDIDLGTEKLKLVIRAKPREGLGISVGGAVNSFLRLGGTLRNPKLQIDPKGTAVTGGVAVATGGLSLLARGLFDRLTAEADICAQEDAVNKN